MSNKYELSDDSVVVVIGSGAGGGTISRELSTAGIDVVCLEAGSHISPIVNDSQHMFGKLTWFDKRIGSGDLPANFPVWSGKGVGGTTIHWTASTPRIHQHEFTPSRYFGHLKDCSVIDWTIPRDEMAHYYTLAEKDMGVSGTNGWPKLPKSNNYRVLEAGAKRIGLKQVERGKMAINSVARNGRPACIQLGFCVSGCAIDAKWTAANTPLAQALATSHFELRTESFALRVEHDDNGKVIAVVYADSNGDLQRQKARAVCVAANSIDTPRILLNSDSALFDKGLANKSGHVGRHYTKHVFGLVTAIMPHPVNMHRGTDNMGIVSDFVSNNPSLGYSGGFKFEQVNFDPTSLANLSRPGTWGSEYAAQLGKYDHYTALLVMGEDPAQADNRVTLHASEKDQYSMPVPVVHYENHENSNKMREFALGKAHELYKSLGSKEVFTGPPSPATHNMGTCRMAKKIDDGVCDPHGRTFDIPNLFVSDGSVFPSSGSSNPTITIVALATRQAAHIKDLMSRKEL